MRPFKFQRIRSQGEFYTPRFEMTYRNTGAWTWEGRTLLYGWPWESASGRISTIKDTNQGGQPHFRVADCLHDSLDASGLLDLQPILWLGGGYSELSGRPPLSRGLLESLVPFTPETLWEEHGERAFNTFSTAFPEEVSLVNFVWELRELGEMIPALESSLTGTVASGYLNVEFAWKPFLGDLNKLYTLVDRTHARLSTLRKSWGRKTRLGYGPYRVTLPSVVQTVTTPFLPNPIWEPDGSEHPEFVLNRGVTDFSFTYSVLTAERLVRCGGYLFHQISELDSFVGLLRAFLYAAGANPLKTFWAAMPYSFLVDWLFNISRALGRLVQPADPWIVNGVSTTVETAAWIQVEQVIHPGEYAASRRYDLGRVKVHRYERFSGFPVRESLFTPDTLDPHQLTLFLAMLTGASRH